MATLGTDIVVTQATSNPIREATARCGSQAALQPSITEPASAFYPDQGVTGTTDLVRDDRPDTGQVPVLMSA